MATFTFRTRESIIGCLTAQIVAGGRDMHWDRLRAFAASASYAAANLLASLRLNMPYGLKRVAVPVTPANVERTPLGCRSTGQDLWRTSGRLQQRIG